MRITRLHLILFVAIFFIAGILFYQVQQEKYRKVVAQLEEQKRAEQKKLADFALEQKKQEEQLVQIKANQAEKKKELAIAAVAVAGEYWIITKKEGRDLSKGQATLKAAKEFLAAERFEEAYTGARQSIEEFKAAPLIKLNKKQGKIYYKVMSGDCLWKIAKMPRHYGDGSKWKKIWLANKHKIKNYRLIYPRQLLYIPKK